MIESGGDRIGGKIPTRVPRLRTSSYRLPRRSLVLIPQIDVFHTLNANTLLTQATTFEASLGNPSTILTGRLVRFQMRVPALTLYDSV